MSSPVGFNPSTFSQPFTVETQKKPLTEAQLAKEVQAIAEHYNLTEEETIALISAIHSSREEASGIRPLGKLSWAVKILRAAWDKIPAKVKAAIGGAAGFETILKVIDTYTGKVEEAVYAGAYKVTNNKTAAWWISKTLMLFL